MRHAACLFLFMYSLLSVFANAFAFNDTITHPELSKNAIGKSETTLTRYLE